MCEVYAKTGLYRYWWEQQRTMYIAISKVLAGLDASESLLQG